MFNLWYKHGVGKNWFKNLEYSLCITLTLPTVLFINLCFLEEVIQLTLLWSLGRIIVINMVTGKHVLINLTSKN